MFSKKQVNLPSSKQELSIINQDTIIDGNITSRCSLRIDGTVNGNVEVSEKLLICDNAKVIGDIKAQEIEVCGQVDGIIRTSGLISVKENGKVKGDIFYSQIEIEAGAQLESSLIQTKGKSEQLPEIQEAKTA